MPPHFLRCQGLAVNDYSFALGRLETGAPSTFAQLVVLLKVKGFLGSLCQKLKNDFQQIIRSLTIR